MYETTVLKTGINEELLARVLVIKHLEKMKGVVRPVKIAVAVSYTVYPVENFLR